MRISLLIFAPVLVSCTSNRYLKAVNETPGVIRVSQCSHLQHCGKDLLIQPGSVVKIPVFESRTIDLLVFRYRQTESHFTLVANGVSYSLPDKFNKESKAWSKLPWPQQISSGYSGTLRFSGSNVAILKSDQDQIFTLVGKIDG